jgi:hypothetical protein
MGPAAPGKNPTRPSPEETAQIDWREDIGIDRELARMRVDL